LLIQVLMEQTMGSLSNTDAMGEMFDNLEKKLEPGADKSLRDFIGAGRALKNSRSTSAGGSSTGAKMQPPISFEKVAAAASGPASGYNSYSHNFAGMLLMFLLFAAQSRAKHLLVERDSGTLVRLRLTPASDTKILLGVGLSTTLIALLASVVVYAIGIVVFGIRISGSPAGFVGVVFAQALFVGGFALLLAGLGRTEEQIGSLGTFAVLVMSFAGGAMFPSFMMPEWLRSVSLVLPTYWATNGLAATTWRGLGASSALLPVVFLIVSAAVCTVVGIRRFRFRSLAGSPRLQRALASNCSQALRHLRSRSMGMNGKRNPTTTAEALSTAMAMNTVWRPDERAAPSACASACGIGLPARSRAACAESSGRTSSARASTSPKMPTANAPPTVRNKSVLAVATPRSFQLTLL
jgi:ABC-type multidrug transport system permease subunit